MADNKIKFWPIRGKKEQIINQPYYDGKIYFATDTNEIYLDADGAKHKMGGSGGSGSGIVYAVASESDIIKVSEDDSDNTYRIPYASFEESEVEPQKGALILNSDGRFFRVLDTDSVNKMATVSLVAVSGTGTGGGGGGSQPAKSDLTFSYNTETIDQAMTFIYGQDYYADFTAISETDNVVSLSFILTNSSDEVVYTSTARATSGEAYAFNTRDLPKGDNLKLTVTATAANSANPNGVRRVIPYLKVVEMGITKSPTFNASTALTGSQLVEYYLAGGQGLTERVNVSIDGIEYYELGQDNIRIDSNVHRITVPGQTHGVHTVRLWLTTEINGVTLSSSPISYDMTWIDEESETPLIWTDEFVSPVIQYENFAIKYQVYNPEAVSNNSTTEVKLYKEGVEVSTVYPRYSSENGWLTWDLTELYEVGENHFSISNGVTTKAITFNVTTEGSRDLGLAQLEALDLNLSSNGRSNEESKATRSVWASKNYETEFKDFNWYNNGWKSDVGDNKLGSYLSVANGAKVNIKYRQLPLNSGTDYTIEARFRVRNIQEYSTLVTVDPHYFVLDESGHELPDSVSLEGIKAENLNVAVDKDGNWKMDEQNSPKKVKSTEGVALKLMGNDEVGLCIGTQEAYFHTESGTVNVRYKEDEVINITFVISSTDKLLSIYLNGILSGAMSLATTRSFTLGSSVFEINSDYCDIDLFKLRVYQAGLTMPEVIHNYISDTHDIALYDQNQLAKDFDATALSFEKVINYNKEQTSMDTLTMPYATFEIIDNRAGMTDPNGGGHPTTDDRLPYYKGNDRYVAVNFVNPSLDWAYDHDLITRDYYLHHCPSFSAVGAELNVQGTSSQGYPRRNYKVKFKSAAKATDGNKVKHDDWKWVFTNKKFIADMEAAGEKKKISKWFEDNIAHATNKFTLKVDYMESSGTYNTGFANLVGTMYGKHPLEDYKLDGVSNAATLRTSVYGFPIMAFWKHSKPEDIAKVGTNLEDDIYEYIGRYNWNLDKGSNEYYGFEEDAEQKYIVSEEFTKQVENKETGVMEDKTYYRYNGFEYDHKPTVADISECWELTDNQGTWTSFSYPTEAQENKFKTLASDGKLEVLNHFEYRYIADDDTVDEAMDGTTGGTFANTTEINDYLYRKYANLEKFFNWLDSTDTRKASSATLPSPVKYTVAGKTEGDDANTTYERSETGDIIAATYTTDCAGYRLQKFKNEFALHLDEEYCSVYYVMTELLLCYDSRGKNMMLASYGPQKRGGEYIWYPIFYDIDTQLGLNNIGATLWDYDTDATLELAFSTPSSVLWVNFLKMFGNSIQNKYEELRAKSKLTYENIENSYLCSPDTFDSYAMKGLRPIIVLGLDLYYKYIAPSKTGYYDTTGAVVYDNNSYAYAINGDRMLSRQLFLRNRLNYMDSYWMAGDYTSEQAIQSGARFRSGANQAGTSDTYLDSGLLDTVPQEGYTLAAYPKPYFDAVPNFTLTPFLKQYVFTFTDKIPDGQAVKFQGTPVATTVSDSVVEGYKITPGLPEQIRYVPGVDYLSSMGDLSLTYPSQLTVMRGKRLLDFTVGSDVPGYYNNMLGAGTGQFNMNDGALNANREANPYKKTLLQKVILTNITKLADAIDVSGSEKLREFRALGTQIPNVTFAEGAPLDTVHLPKSVNRIELTEAQNITRILEEKPVVCTLDSSGTAIYANRDSYKGLYIEGLTDATSATQSTAINQIGIVGGGLGYDAYKLMKKAVDIKEIEKAGNDSMNISMSFEDMNWSPYEVVPVGTPYDSQTQYYRLTDHSNFVEFTFTTAQDWVDLLVNEKIFTYNANPQESLIDSTKYFDLFLKDYELGVAANNKVNHYTNMQNSGKSSVPSITGSVFISNANGTPIAEEDITNKYQVRWPNLKFYAANVKEAYVAKYVQVLDSGKEQEIDVIRQANSITTLPLTKKLPKVTYYDLKGWATDKEGNNMIATSITNSDGEVIGMEKTDAYDSTLFSENNSVITIYAIFVKHPYTISFKNPNGEVLETLTATYGETIPEPSVVPSTDESSLVLTQTYKFKGWVKNAEDGFTTKNKLNRVLLKLNETPVTRDTDVYACYVEQSVYDEPTNLNYFTFSTATYEEATTGAFASSFRTIPQYLEPDKYNITGVEINIKPGIKLSGKISLPTYDPDGRPVISIGSTFSSTADTSTRPVRYPGGALITHVFWYKTDGKASELRFVNNSAFASDVSKAGIVAPRLEYFEFPEKLRLLKGSAFAFMYSLKTLDLNENLLVLENGALCRAMAPNSVFDTIKIPASLAVVSYTSLQALAYRGTINRVQFGDSEHGSHLTTIGREEGADSLIGTNYDGRYMILSNCTINKFEFWASSEEQRAAFENRVKANENFSDSLNKMKDDDRSFVIAG